MNQLIQTQLPFHIQCADLFQLNQVNHVLEPAVPGAQPVTDPVYVPCHLPLAQYRAPGDLGKPIENSHRSYDGHLLYIMKGAGWGILL